MNSTATDADPESLLAAYVVFWSQLILGSTLFLHPLVLNFLRFTRQRTLAGLALPAEGMHGVRLVRMQASRMRVRTGEVRTPVSDPANQLVKGTDVVHPKRGRGQVCRDPTDRTKLGGSRRL